MTKRSSRNPEETVDTETPVIPRQGVQPEDVGVPPTAGTEHSSSPDVTWETKWWGFHIYLNSAAVDKLEEIKDKFVEVGSKILTGNGPAMYAAALAQKAWIRAVAGSGGVKLTAPWCSPLMLIPTRWQSEKPPKDDPRLWWTVYNATEDKWGDDQRFPEGISSNDQPTLVANKGELSCWHTGTGDHANTIRETRYNPNVASDKERWTRSEARISGTWSNAAACSFNDKIHTFVKETEEYCYLRSWDDSRGNKILAQEKLNIRGTPALAVVLNTLCNAYCDSTGQIWFRTWDGQKWSSAVKLDDCRSPSGVALSPLLGYDDNVYAGVYFGGEDESIYRVARKLDGSGGGVMRLHPTRKHYTSGVPAIYTSPYSWISYMVHKGHKNDGRLWFTEQRGAQEWLEDRVFPDHYSKTGPGLHVYQDKQSNTSQIMCVHRGAG